MTFKFKREAIPVVTDNEFDSLFLWEDINPELMLDDDEEIQQVYEAMDVIQAFLDQAVEEGLILIDEEE